MAKDIHTYSLDNSPQEFPCPACGHHVAVSFYDGGDQPLATLGWPESADEARAMSLLPLTFVRCVGCGHVYNAHFSADNVPYSEKPNLMFNQAQAWGEFLTSLRDKIDALLTPDATVVEVGYGDASFLSALAEKRAGGRLVGFDPNGAQSETARLELHQAYFEPHIHMPELAPNLIISRHCLEHMDNPLGFIQKISFCAQAAGIRSVVYFEVPCIDRAISSRRTVDFYYEHNSQFTTASFTRMLELSTANILEIGHAYDDEVVYGLAELGVPQASVDNAAEASAFLASCETGLATIGQQLQALHASDDTVVIWGGTGKSAAFMWHYGVDAERFPLVVDSDEAKVGTFVPGTGQTISSKRQLQDLTVGTIIIPPQWRAADIRLELQQAGIAYEALLIEHNGQLVNFESDEHPYRL
jgi:hypothetical protein